MTGLIILLDFLASLTTLKSFGKIGQQKSHKGQKFAN